MTNLAGLGPPPPTMHVLRLCHQGRALRGARAVSFRVRKRAQDENRSGLEKGPFVLADWFDAHTDAVIFVLALAVLAQPVAAYWNHFRKRQRLTRWGQLGEWFIVLLVVAIALTLYHASLQRAASALALKAVTPVSNPRNAAASCDGAPLAELRRPDEHRRHHGRVQGYKGRRGIKARRSGGEGIRGFDRLRARQGRPRREPACDRGDERGRCAARGGRESRR